MQHAREIRELCVSAKRSAGRPRTRWGDIKIDIQNIVDLLRYGPDSSGTA
jgi:hypothetical protein